MLRKVQVVGVVRSGLLTAVQEWLSSVAGSEWRVTVHGTKVRLRKKRRIMYTDATANDEGVGQSVPSP